MSAAVALFFVSAAEALAREVELIEWVSGWVTNVIFYTWFHMICKKTEFETVCATSMCCEVAAHLF